MNDSGNDQEGSKCSTITLKLIFCRRSLKKLQYSDENEDGHKEQTTEMAASPRRQGIEELGTTGRQAVPAMHLLPSNNSGIGQYPSSIAGLRLQNPSMVVQSDFRKVSGISTEIFRQIETVEKDHDATTAAALEAVERRGEMLVRVLDPRQMGRVASEAARTFLTMQDPKHAVHFVEIVKRPGQTLGLYIREGNGIDRSDGVFISRIALESAVYNSGCLRVGDEILAVNLVDVTRMSLDDVVIVMSIPRRLVLTTRQRRGPAGVVSPPPPRPEQKPPPVVVLKRGLLEEPLDDSTSNSNSNGGDRGFNQTCGTNARYLAGAKPLPGMADLPINGTFPRDRERSDRERFLEREAGRYPERAPEEATSSNYAGSITRTTAEHYDKESIHFNFRQGQIGDVTRESRFQSAEGSGTLNRKALLMSGTDRELSQVDSYRPPPPPKVITEQPKGGGSAPQHFHPFERNYPKTLESLAERVHPFYGLQDSGAMGLSLPPGTTGQAVRQGHSATLGRASTLGRIRGGSNQAKVSSNTMSLMRAGRGMQRSGSDQRLPLVEGGSDFYEYMMSNMSTTKCGLKSSSPSIGLNYSGLGVNRSAGGGHASAAPGSDATSRLGVTRRRTSIDYASDTEASTRGYGGSRQHTMPSYGVERPWKTQALIGLTPTTPTASVATFVAHQQASSRLMKNNDQSRSNSLPRTDGSARYRRGVRFEQESRPNRPPAVDSQEDSDGAASAPELPSSQKHQQALAQKLAADAQLAFHSLSGRIAAPPSVFTAAEYKAWMQRAPSTSAIYERLKQGREAFEAQRAAKFTYSAENLLDKTRQESPYYAYRSHLTATHVMQANMKEGGADTEPSAKTKAGPINRTTDETRGIPQPTPGRSTDPRFKLLEINPAEYMKYRSERPEGPVLSSHQGMPTSGSGIVTPSGPGPAPGGMEEGISGLLWVHLLAGRCLRSTSSRLEPVRDLYCVIECDRAHKARTVIRTGDVNFDWDETFDLDLVVNREIDFLIYSWDPQLRHRLCFKGSLHLVPLLRESPMHQIALKVEPRGTIYLKLRYTEPRTAFRRMPAARKTVPPLFGVDLETVVTREGSGLGIPILVQKCIEEVERRGMDIVGLYRLCGSATKKRILREAFERNPRLVDLSPDSVPDINVITGLLKEYLRELPEPLLTKCLYQMLVDALAVCLPDDPEGNAKLMFSILECLPKSNRTTLFLLMDHLCLVTAQSDRNKMTPQNLAICFGPVLMLHSDDVSSLDFQKPIGVLKYLLQIWPMKSARAAEAAATASLTLRRSTLRSQLQPALVASAQQALPTEVAAVVAAAATAAPSSTTTISKATTPVSANRLLLTSQSGHADRSLDLPPLPPRPTPRVPGPKISVKNESSDVKSEGTLSVFGAMANTDDMIAPRGEADGSPAPLSDFLPTTDSAGAGSEDVTPASSVTPSLTSPTSTSTTSVSPQQLLRGVAGVRRKKDFTDTLSSQGSQSQAVNQTKHGLKDIGKGIGQTSTTRADDTDQGESDLDSPN